MSVGNMLVAVRRVSDSDLARKLGLKNREAEFIAVQLRAVEVTLMGLDRHADLLDQLRERMKQDREARS